MQPVQGKHPYLRIDDLLEGDSGKSAAVIDRTTSPQGQVITVVRFGPEHQAAFEILVEGIRADLEPLSFINVTATVIKITSDPRAKSGAYVVFVDGEAKHFFAIVDAEDIDVVEKFSPEVPLDPGNKYAVGFDEEELTKGVITLNLAIELVADQAGINWLYRCGVQPPDVEDEALEASLQAFGPTMTDLDDDFEVEDKRFRTISFSYQR